MLLNFLGRLVPLNLCCILVEMEGFGVVRIPWTNYYPFAQKLHFYPFILVINLERHTTCSRASFMHSVYWVCGCGNHNCFTLIILGFLGD